MHTLLARVFMPVIIILVREGRVYPYFVLYTTSVVNTCILYSYSYSLVLTSYLRREARILRIIY